MVTGVQGRRVGAGAPCLLVVIWADLMFLTSVGELSPRSVHVVVGGVARAGVVSPGRHDQRQWTPAARAGFIGRAGSRVYLNCPFSPNLAPGPWSLTGQALCSDFLLAGEGEARCGCPDQQERFISDSMRPGGPLDLTRPRPCCCPTQHSLFPGARLPVPVMSQVSLGTGTGREH